MVCRNWSYLRWKGGQLKLPNGSDQKLVSSVKTYLFQTFRVKLNYPIISRVVL